MNEKQVSFLIMGGAAVAFHDDIDDFDLLVDPTIENATKFVHAVTELAKSAGRPFIKALEPVDLTKPKVRFPFKFAPFYSEFLTPDSHTEFDQMNSRALLTEAGVHQVRVIGLSDIVAMKVEAAKWIIRL